MTWFAFVWCCYHCLTRGLSLIDPDFQDVLVSRYLYRPSHPDEDRWLSLCLDGRRGRHPWDTRQSSSVENGLPYIITLDERPQGYCVQTLICWCLEKATRSGGGTHSAACMQGNRLGPNRNFDPKNLVPLRLSSAEQENAPVLVKDPPHPL